MFRHPRRAIGLIASVFIIAGILQSLIALKRARETVTFDDPIESSIIFPSIPSSNSPGLSSSPYSSNSSYSSFSLSSTQPPRVRISVPFQSQAPLLNWDALHEESCEEASLILVHAYLKHIALTPQSMETAIQDMVNWERHHGYKDDVTASELAQIAKDYFGLTANVIDLTSTNDLEQLIAQGKPVIIPAAGRALGNPYFTGEGPWYHMLVVTGYDPTHFITNDVGTRRGEGYRYKKDVLFSAIHDWVGEKERIVEGVKRGIVIGLP